MAVRTRRRGTPTRAARAYAVPVSLLAVVAAVGAMLVADPQHPPFQQLDAAWRETMLGTRGAGPTRVALAANVVGRFPFWLASTLLAAGWWAVRRRWWAAGYMLAATITTTILTGLLKYVVPRPRPLDGLVLVGVGSYPSGHVVHATTTVLAVVLLAGPAVRRRYGWPLVVAVAAWMGWSRTYLSVHWLSDVVAGAALATAVCLLLWRWWAPADHREARPEGTGPPGDAPRTGRGRTQPQVSARRLPSPGGPDR